MDLRKRLFSNLTVLLLALILVTLVINLAFLFSDTRREINASTNLMKELVAIGNATCTASALADQQGLGKLIDEMQLRHVQVALDGEPDKDRSRSLVETIAESIIRDAGWFTPQTLLINGHFLRFMPDPSAELQEHLDQLGRTLLMILGFSIASVAAVLLSADRALKPVRALEKFILDLAEDKDINTLPNFKLKEYEQLATALNNLAKSLSAVRNAQKDFSKKIITAIETERESIARDLHDELGQSITALSYNGKFAEARSRHSEDGDLFNCCSEIRRLTSDLNVQLKSVIKRLRPLGTEVADLVEGINDLIAAWTSSLIGIEFEFKHDDVVSLMTSQQTMNLYRIAQESITNVIRHSRATRCQIVINKVGDRIQLKISDNGIGITDSEVRIHGGLYGIRERAEMMGAELSIENGELGGLTVHVSLSQQNASPREQLQ